MSRIRSRREKEIFDFLNEEGLMKDFKSLDLKEQEQVLSEYGAYEEEEYEEEEEADFAPQSEEEEDEEEDDNSDVSVRLPPVLKRQITKPPLDEEDEEEEDRESRECSTTDEE